MPTEIVPGLYVGIAADAAALGPVVPSYWRIISVTEYRAKYGRSEECPNEPVGPYALDLPFMHVAGGRRKAVLETIADHIELFLAGHKQVLVHCVHAHERSPLAIMYYLVRSGRVHDIDAAYAFVKSKHPPTEDRRSWLP